MKFITFTNQFDEEITVMFEKGTYANNGNLYIGALSVCDGYLEPYCNITVNLPEFLDDNKAYLDINNANHQLLIKMKKAGLIKYCERNRASGFCSYPLYEFSQKFLDDIPELLYHQLRVGGEKVKVKDLVRYIHEKVSIYNDSAESEFATIYEGKVENIPSHLLDNDIKVLGAKRKGIVDIGLKLEKE